MSVACGWSAFINLYASSQRSRADPSSPIAWWVWPG